jgi:glycosyltransferase involved in cell wall biosynthesis
VDTIANPTDFEEIDRMSQGKPDRTKPQDKPLLVAVGRLHRQKRYDLLIDAFARVRDAVDATLWICGEGLCRSQIENDIRSRRLSDYVTLLGYVENPFPIIRQADAYVMTSDYEGLPNSLIEAQGLGIPAVAARCNYGPDEIVEDNQTGFLVPTGSSEATATAIIKLLASSAQREEMGQRAAQRMRRLFDVHVLTKKWEDKFEALLQ